MLKRVHCLFLRKFIKYKQASHILNNPSALRETMKMATNPKMMLELMHHQDRVIANIESMPGGFNALQRMYRVIQ